MGLKLGMYRFEILSLGLISYQGSRHGAFEVGLVEVSRCELFGLEKFPAETAVQGYRPTILNNYAVRICIGGLGRKSLWIGKLTQVLGDHLFIQLRSCSFQDMIVSWTRWFTHNGS